MGKVEHHGEEAELQNAEHGKPVMKLVGKLLFPESPFSFFTVETEDQP